MNQKLFTVCTLLGLLAFSSSAQNLVDGDIINVALVCKVQQGNNPVNEKIDTKALLQLIAADQGFTLPSNPRLALDLNTFFVLNQAGDIFTNVDTNLLSVVDSTYVDTTKVMENKHTYLATIKGNTFVSLAYSGASVSFTFDCLCDTSFLNKENLDKHTNNAVVVSSFSGTGVGSGTNDDRAMTITGTMTGKNLSSSDYTTGEPGTFPTNGNPTGAFPGQ
jgi:hypothetical protein